jgi:hypothetical protein
VKDCLTNNTFLVYAMKMYSNPLCTGIDEFQEDILRIKYIKRLLLKYKKTRVLKTRLILNHVIVMQNMFGAEACVRILFFKIPKDLHCYLKSFFEYLNYLPYSIPEVSIHNIKSDENILRLLKEIK